MTRRVDEFARTELLERIADYVVAKGVASLSLRPLAKELNVSAAALLYHFGSKEALTVDVLKVAGDRQRGLLASLRMREGATSREICDAIWNAVSAPEARPIFRLFFEVYGLALVDRDRFPNVFPAAIENWLGLLVAPFVRDGMSMDDARAHATVVLAMFRGFLLDLCATDDRARVDRAFRVWIETWV